MEISKEQIYKVVELREELQEINKKIAEQEELRQATSEYGKKALTKNIEKLQGQWREIAKRLEYAPLPPIDPLEALLEIHDKFGDFQYEVFEEYLDKTFDKMKQYPGSLSHELKWQLSEIVGKEYMAVAFKDWLNISHRENESDFDMVIRSIRWLRHIEESMQEELPRLALSSSSNPENNAISRCQAEAIHHYFTRAER